ncbi:MAG: hypothetical protein M1827_001778 [Pycnora praestabilis]|nr:MAG: hypothetical protein M1827_001778 [Pycnora praestabilis]
MFFGSKIIALVATMSTVAIAAPRSEALTALTSRNDQCPRWSPSNQGAEAIAGLYLGNGNNKSNQVERLIEELVALVIGANPICQPQDLYVQCPDGDHWGHQQPTNEQQWQSQNPQPAWTCDAQHPYQNCGNQYPYMAGCTSARPNPNASSRVSAAL